MISREKKVNDRNMDRKKNKVKDPNAKTLTIVNIPNNLNNITKLSEHFSTYGHIVNIHVVTNKKKALIQFSSHTEALKAFKSPEPVLNNRFIKVYWTNDN